MNALTQFQTANPHIHVMNVLQEAGACSDNAVTTEDVADSDIDGALAYLDCMNYAASFGG